MLKYHVITLVDNVVCEWGGGIFYIFVWPIYASFASYTANLGKGGGRLPMPTRAALPPFVNNPLLDQLIMVPQLPFCKNICH